MWFICNSVAQPVNQPSVTIREGTPYIQFSFPNSTFNLTVDGYMNVSNPSTTSSLQDFNVNYTPFSSNFTINQTGARIFNLTTGTITTISSLYCMNVSSIIHINEIPPQCVYQVSYRVYGQNLNISTNYGVPVLAFTYGNFYYQSASDPTHTWYPQTYVFNPISSCWEIENPISIGDNVSILVTINTTNGATLTNMRFHQQLPRANDPASGNATFTADNITYWSRLGNVPFTKPDNQPDPITNNVDMILTGTLPPNDQVIIQINGSFSNITGVYSPAENAWYIPITPMCTDFNSTKPGESFLGSQINNSSSTWVNSSCDTRGVIIKGFNGILAQWEYRSTIDNPTDITTNLTYLRISRNSYLTPNYDTASQIYAISPGYTIAPGSNYDTNYMQDATYPYNVTLPPIYWVNYSMNLFPLTIGDSSHYSHGLYIGDEPRGNLTFMGPRLRLSSWRLYAQKSITYDFPSRQYFINITVTNIGYNTTPTNVKVYDYIPATFNGTAFMKNGGSYIPDFNGAAFVVGPRTIGWNLGALNSSQSMNVSYQITGDMASYKSSYLYVVGVDPKDIVGAVPGGSGYLVNDMTSQPIELIFATLASALVVAGAVRRFV